MDFPEYREFTRTFGEGPDTYLERLSLPQLRCIARKLEISFIPPFGEEGSEEERRQIIQVALADFQELGQDVDLVLAVQACTEG